MPTSSYMPDVQVEIAFNAGFQTPAASRTWTDVSAYVELHEGLTIQVGRQDERSTADANQLTLTLDNRDGRFTAGRAASPYYPNVKLDRPIRVTATPVDGSATVRFLGFINEWPVEWDATDGYARATITASSRLSRLGLTASLKSIVETVILADGPSAYYTLGEPSGATQANDESGRSKPPLVALGDPSLPVVFGTAIGAGTDSLTAAQFTSGGQYLAGGFSPALSAATGVTIEAFVLRNGPLASGQETFIESTSNAVTRGFLAFSSTGRLQATWLGGGSLISPGTTSYADGQTHHVAFTLSPTTFALYVDGALASSAASGAYSPDITDLSLAYDDLVTAGATTVLSHVAVYETALTAAQIAAHASAGSTGYAGETTSARLVRYAGYAGIPAAEIVTETGQVTVQHVDTTDKQAVDLMRLMETTEGGVLFDDRDGSMTFHNRSHRLTSSAVYTLNMAQQQVEAGYAPKLDRTGLANDVTAADISGNFTARVTDSTSQTDYGLATLSLETAADDDDEPLFLASWALYRYKTPLPRVPALTVNALAQVGKTPNCAAVMATDVGDKITVSNRPTQDASSSGSFFVEGYTETYGPESLFITFNVSPSSPDDQTLVIGDATRGVIGTNPVAL